MSRFMQSYSRNVTQRSAALRKTRGALPCVLLRQRKLLANPAAYSCHVLLIYINACVRAESSAELTRGTDQCEQTFRHIITRAVCNVVFQELTQPNRSTKRRLLFLSRLF